MLRACGFLLIFIPLTFFFALSAILCSLFDRSGALYHRHARGWSRVGLRLAGIKLEVVGAEKVPVGSPVIFMSNHQGNFDILAAIFLDCERGTVQNTGVRPFHGQGRLHPPQ